MSSVRDILARQLLHKQHVALLTHERKTYQISSENPSAKIGKIGNNSLGISIGYNGFDFKVSEVSGNVYLNNTLATSDMKIPDSCVITLGKPELKGHRIFVTFDVSHPEVVL